MRGETEKSESESIEPVRRTKKDSTHPGSDKTGCRMTCGALLGGTSGATSGELEQKKCEIRRSCMVS